MTRWISLESLLAAIADVALPIDPPVTVASRNAEGDTPLQVAAIWSDPEAIELLIGAGADLDAVGDMGYTPLLHAVRQGHVAAARTLLEAGASPHIRSEFGKTAAEEGMRSENPELVSLFTAWDAKSDTGNPKKQV